MIKEIKMRISAFFKWYDLWIGLYIDIKGKAVYICPIPMFGIKIEYQRRKKFPAGTDTECQDNNERSSSTLSS